MQFEHLFLPDWVVGLAPSGGIRIGIPSLGKRSVAPKSLFSQYTSESAVYNDILVVYFAK